METTDQTSVFKICPIYNLKEGIRRGKYDEVHSLISKDHCPLPAQPKAKVKKSLYVALLHFDEFLTAIRILERGGKRHCSPGNGAHLLGFVAKYPNEQYTYPIAVLGSIVKNEHGDDCVLYAYKNLMTGKRILGLYPLKSGFHNLFRFLVVDGHDDSVFELL